MTPNQDANPPKLLTIAALLLIAWCVWLLCTGCERGKVL